MDALLDLLYATLRLGGPIALAAMAGLISERSGVINIALEGKMLGAAGAGAFAAFATGNALIGLLAGIVSAVMLAMLHAAATLVYRIDHVVSGMAVNAVAYGVSGFGAKLLANQGVDAQFQTLPEVLYIVCALVVPAGIFWWMSSTTPGLRLQAVGHDPRKAREMGVNPVNVRAAAQVAVGVIAGVAGMMLVSQPGQFSSGMTAGKGFIALAALILGGWKPFPTAIAAFAFGLFDALQLRLQGKPLLGVDVPTELWASLPYILTLVALAGFLGKSRPPAALGKD
jgi:simple sugar transport system permease protein